MIFILYQTTIGVFFCSNINVTYGQSAEWCGPDGSVVLIRAVRSGLDRVVLELLRAGVSVNNTDHTGEILNTHYPHQYIGNINKDL